MIEDEDELNLPLATSFYTKIYFMDRKHLQMLPIEPLTEKWNFTLLSIFLNELHEFIKKDHCIVELKNNWVSFNFYSSDNDAYSISVKISKDFSKDIIVEASYSWLINKWEVKEYDFESNIGSRNRIIKSYRLQTHIRFFKMFTNLSNASKCIYFRRSILFLSKFDFSKIFNFFVNNISRFGLPLNEDTEILQNYVDIWFPHHEKIYFHSFEELNNGGIKGYFNLILEQAITHKKLQTFSIVENNYYITAGVHVLQNAYSLFHDNSDIVIDGYVLDTTWRITPNYVTSILNACFLNSSLPIAFAFGSGETKYLYDLLLQTTESQLNINFSDSIFESDEGPALRSICEERSIMQLKCTRHFLEKLKKMDYYYEIKHLIQCTSQIDFQNAIECFSMQFSQICIENPDEFLKINSILSKIGLVFIDGQISIENELKWNKVSLLKRIDYHMPSTTNTLEAMHGHLNKRSLRRNSFFCSLFRIINELNSKYSKINQRIQHNYYYTKSKTMKNLQKTDTSTLSNMIQFYESSQVNCQCGQNKLEMANFKINIPCIHQIALGAEFEDLPEIKLTLYNQYENLTIEYLFSQNLNLPPQNFDEKQ